MRLHGAPVRVRVPATSANLGPGFDAFGLALTLHDELEVQVSGSGLQVEVAGEGAGEVPLDDRHLVVRALHAAFDELGAAPRGLWLRAYNRIPHGRGLGSSAAAIVAGVLAARALTVDGEQALPGEAVLALATRLEGHPDNVAAALGGGFTLAWQDGQGPRAVRLEHSAQLAPVAFVPAERSATEQARALLPEQVSHRDAARNAARAALLVEALARRPDLLLDATEDRLHQPYRAAAMPESAGLVDRLRRAGIPAVLSGAGPTVLALPSPEQRERCRAEQPAGWRTHELGVDETGAQVRLGED